MLAVAGQLAVGLRRFIEAPLILGSSGELGHSVRGLGRLVARVQTGLLRSYALLIAGSLLLIAIVFLSVR